jgi:hypothetical protein
MLGIIGSVVKIVKQKLKIDDTLCEFLVDK